MSKPIETLMQKEMDRREFLVTLAFGLASIAGFSTIIHLLTGKSIHERLGQYVSSGYGSTTYGGSK